MKISVKLTGFLVGVVALFAGLAITLLTQLQVVSAGYDALLQKPVRQADAARIAQVDFKKQVQEWKDILLRGHNADDLKKYSKQFHEREALVRDEAAELARVVGDTEAQQLLAAFVTAHATLATQYQGAFEVYMASGHDFKAADKIVRGKDRAPTDLFDKVVARLDARVKEAVAAQRMRVERNRNVALTVAGLLLLSLALGGCMVVHGIVSRLGRLKAVSDRLARADVQGLAIDISGRDEVGEFGESLKAVHAAIEELSTLAAARSSMAS